MENRIDFIGRIVLSYLFWRYMSKKILGSFSLEEDIKDIFGDIEYIVKDNLKYK